MRYLFKLVMFLGYCYVVNNVSSFMPISKYKDCMFRIQLLTSLRYSPTSPCLNTVIPVGSNLRASAVDLAVTPKPCFAY